MVYIFLKSSLESFSANIYQFDEFFENLGSKYYAKIFSLNMVKKSQMVKKFLTKNDVSYLFFLFSDFGKLFFNQFHPI